MNRKIISELCPICAYHVTVESSCPGYSYLIDGKEATLVCNPPWSCGNADEFRCASRYCDWWYREPNNRSDKDSMGVKPSWDMRQYNLDFLSGEDEVDEGSIVDKDN